MLLSLDGTALVSTRRPWGTPLLPSAEPDSLGRVAETHQPVVGAVVRPPRGGRSTCFRFEFPSFEMEAEVRASAIVQSNRLRASFRGNSRTPRNGHGPFWTPKDDCRANSRCGGLHRHPGNRRIPRALRQSRKQFQAKRHEKASRSTRRRVEARTAGRPWSWSHEPHWTHRSGHR